MLDRGAGSVVNLHVGTRPDPAAYGGEYSPEYASEVRKQPDISTEGDGLKVFYRQTKLIASGAGKGNL